MRFLPMAFCSCLALASPGAVEALDVVAAPEDEHAIDMDRAWGLLDRQRAGETLTEAEAAILKEAMDYRSKWRDLQNRRRNGETLTAEEDAFLNRALEENRKRREAARAAYRKEHPPRDSTGMVPLNDLAGIYQGEEGGLYAGGGNTPPQGHLKAGLAVAEKVVPLNGAGEPTEDGRIVLLSIGMSNTTQEYQAFVKLAEADPEVSPRVAIVDGAQGGQSADRTADPGANFWNVIDRRLEQAGATREQVQVVWIKQATPGPKAPFPAEAKALQGHLETNLNILADRFPNLKIAYLSSRIYAGYAESGLNPEPHAYESAFAVKWLIAEQAAGKLELNYDQALGPVLSPWLAWGPYLWADGLKSRSDGLTYTRDDLADDGTHPAQSGRLKVAQLLLDFLRTDPTARPWFTAMRP